MKNLKTFKQVILIVLMGAFSASAYCQFQGTMVFNTMDKDRQFKVYSSDEGYRYEFEEAGKKGIVIVKTGSQDVIILMPEEKMAMISSSQSPMSMGMDPLKQYETQKAAGLIKEEGKETINGVECMRSVLWNKENTDQKLYTIWFSEKYKFPMKLISHVHGVENTGMEMKDVKPWTPDASSFAIPEGYQVMDVPQMR